MTATDRPMASLELGVWELIRSDFRRYRATGARSAVGVILLTQGFWASAVYRLSHRSLSIDNQLTCRTMHLLLLFAQKAVEITTGISLPDECEVGRALYIGHFGTVIVSGGTRIGHNCSLSQGVTVGYKGRGALAGHPTLGDRVYLGAQAIIIGGITIGDDTAVGAGAVVTRSLPPRAVAVGNPARIISYDGSFEYVSYDGMESDPGRTSALAARELGRAAKP